MKEELKSEIRRALRVLGATKGYSQNWIDIHQWKKDHYITDKEEKELLSYNRIESLNPIYKY